ncbi:hypothetical protein UA08_09513 [Talaromyces atroroseus]|uniref:Uncharacterized protein n=1 Tax=Talaromyces atroroseus TaxID=1441469 RepID=A0A1Q5Q5W7_TALAT|nr:hypothetical protein UA08_09513 [Talaromyces atroroseus]OKL55214.1 hypothetical protein UA08_09513 [Talaromyces atroroseus]
MKERVTVKSPNAIWFKMRYFLAVLLPLSTLFHVCFASHNATGVEHLLVRRAMTATDLFSIKSENTPGGCSAAQQAQLTAWIADAVKLHDAAVAAYGFSNGLKDAAHLWFFMGMKFSAPGTPTTDQDSDMYKEMGDRLAGVTEFLNGNGVRGAKARTKPLFWCSDAFADFADWDEPAKDKNGNTIPKPNSGDNVFTLEQLFPDLYEGIQGGKSMEPFWADVFNGYVVQGTDVERLCFSTLYAATPRARAADNVKDGIDVKVGTFERFIYFCNNGWTQRPGVKENTALASLADAITYANYPTAGSRAQSLAAFTPISATFYHELFHLTDYTTDTKTKPITGDPFPGLGSIVNAAQKQNPEITRNPESFNFFAMASYLVRNPPATPDNNPKKPAVLFFGGFPVDANSVSG